MNSALIELLSQLKLSVWNTILCLDLPM